MAREAAKRDRVYRSVRDPAVCKSLMGIQARLHLHSPLQQ